MQRRMRKMDIIHPMRRFRCFVFDLQLKLRSSRPSKSKRKIRLFIYVCVLPTSLPHGLSARLRLVCKIMNYFWDNQIFQNKNAEWNKKNGFDKYLLQGMSVCDKFCFFTYTTEVAMMCHITYINNPRWSASYHIYSVNTSFVNLLVGTVVAMSLIRSKNNWLEASTRLSNE